MSNSTGNIIVLHGDAFLFADRNCDPNSYNNLANGTCDQCASVCTGGCTGNLTTAVEGGCNMCKVVLLNSAGSQVLLKNCDVLSDPVYYCSEFSYNRIPVFLRMYVLGAITHQQHHFQPWPSYHKLCAAPVIPSAAYAMDQ